MQGSIREVVGQGCGKRGGVVSRPWTRLVGMRDRGDGMDLQVGWGVKHGIDLDGTRGRFRVVQSRWWGKNLPEGAKLS